MGDMLKIEFVALLATIIGFSLSSEIAIKKKIDNLSSSPYENCVEISTTFQEQCLCAHKYLPIPEWPEEVTRFWEEVSWEETYNVLDAWLVVEEDKEGKLTAVFDYSSAYDNSFAPEIRIKLNTTEVYSGNTLHYSLD